MDGNENLVVFQSQEHQDHLFSNARNSPHNFHVDTRRDFPVFGTLMFHQFLQLNVETGCGPFLPPDTDTHLVLVPGLLSVVITQLSLITLPSRQQVIQGSKFLVTEGALDTFPDDADEDKLVI